MATRCGAFVMFCPVNYINIVVFSRSSGIVITSFWKRVLTALHVLVCNVVLHLLVCTIALHVLVCNIALHVLVC